MYMVSQIANCMYKIYTWLSIIAKKLTGASSLSVFMAMASISVIGFF